MTNKFVHYGAVLLVIAGVSAGLLGFVNSKTARVIAENNVKAQDEARREVLPSAKTFDISKKIEKKGIDFIPGYDDKGQVVGYATTVTQGGGYAGDISFVLGVGTDGKITGLKVTAQNETPGLGAKISESGWQAKWKGRDKSYQFNKSVDAFAGASISPTAVYTGVIRALDAFEEVKK